MNLSGGIDHQLSDLATRQGRETEMEIELERFCNSEVPELKAQLMANKPFVVTEGTFDFSDVLLTIADSEDMQAELDAALLQIHQGEKLEGANSIASIIDRAADSFARTLAERIYVYQLQNPSIAA